MQRTTKLEWIEKGYEMMAMEGSGSLRVEVLSRVIGKNKSSFYYHFGGMEAFEQALLAYHMECVDQMAEKIQQCQNIRPDLFHLFLAHQTDLFFHKQLRIHRDNAIYQACFTDAFSKIETAMLPQWGSFFGLSEQHFFARVFLGLIAENFLLQITPQTLSYDWLNQYLKYIHSFWLQLNPQKDV
jgi:AcrR family transcriptional regulator